MAVLTTQQIAAAGLAPSYSAAAAGGDKVAPGKATFLHVKNASGGSITVTVNSAHACDFGFDHDLVVAVGAGADKMIGPLPADRFAAADGKVAVTYSGVTSLTVAAVSA